MNTFRALAIVLIIAGAFMLASPMLSFTTEDKVLDLGPLEVTRQEQHRVPLPPILGGALVVIGIGLFVTAVKRPA